MTFIRSADNTELCIQDNLGHIIPIVKLDDLTMEARREVILTTYRFNEPTEGEQKCTKDTSDS